MKRFERKLSQNRMIVVITGGNGFVAQKLAKTLLTTEHNIKFDELILVDIQKPVSPVEDDRLKCLTFNLTEDGAIEELFNTTIDIIFHLAAVVSGHSEKDIDLGHKVNFDVTHKLLEVIRREQRSQTKFVFTSTCAVYGMPHLFQGQINELSAHFPECSYGSQKSMAELLINDYTRKGFVDGRVVRLPTVTVRAGEPNQAVTSFASGIVREPLSQKVAVCPVDKSTKIWICSPETIVKNLIHAARLPAEDFGPHRNVNLPGITVSVDEMVTSLAEIAGEETAQLIRFEKDEDIDRIVSSLPISFDVERALSLGFIRDNDFSQIIRSYIDSELKSESSSSSSSSSSSESSSESSSDVE